MPTGHLESFMRSLRRWAGGGSVFGLTDAQLLERFVRQHEEAAFASLVRSHGPMVFGVCRHFQHNLHDAEDAFQATFLVLARKAGAISKRDSVGSWLYGVAYRIAARERNRLTERHRHEMQLVDAISGERDFSSKGPENWSILSEELNRLPEKYRAPLVLHYLEGKTKDETAIQLGWAEGTVSGRLARGRELLRGRLVRRGVEASSALVVCGFAAKDTLLTVPQSLMNAVLQNANLTAAGKSLAIVISPKVIALAKGVERTMLLSKVKFASVILITTGLVVGGTAWTATSLPIGQADEKPKPARKAEAKKTPRVKTDLERMQGDWKVVFRKQSGREDTKDRMERWDSYYLFQGDSLTIRDKSKFLPGTIQLNPTANPKTVDVTIGKGAEKREGIYTFDGEKLIVSWAGWDKPRPTKFSAEKEDKGNWIMILEKDSKVRKQFEDQARKNKDSEARLKISGSLYQLARATHGYIEKHGHFPHAAITDKEGKALLSWRVALLPSLGYEELYKEFNLNEPWDSPHNKLLLAKMPQVFGAPSQEGKTLGDTTYYQVFVGKDTIFEEGKDIGIQDITDGTVSTILIIEAGKAVHWTKPEDLPFSADKPVPELGGAIGDGLVSLVTADAAPHRLRKGVDDEFVDTLKAYIRRNSERNKYEWKDLDQKDLDQ